MPTVDLESPKTLSKVWMWLPSDPKARFHGWEYLESWWIKLVHLAADVACIARILPRCIADGSYNTNRSVHKEWPCSKKDPYLVHSLPFSGSQLRHWRMPVQHSWNVLNRKWQKWKLNKEMIEWNRERVSWKPNLECKRGDCVSVILWKFNSAAEIWCSMLGPEDSSSASSWRQVPYFCVCECGELN